MKSIFGRTGTTRDSRKEPLIESLRSTDESTVHPSTCNATGVAAGLSLFQRRRSSQPPPPAFSTVPSVDDVSVKEPPVMRRKSKTGSTPTSTTPIIGSTIVATTNAAANPEDSIPPTIPESSQQKDKSSQKAPPKAATVPKQTKEASTKTATTASSKQSKQKTPLVSQSASNSISSKNSAPMPRLQTSSEADEFSKHKAAAAHANVNAILTGEPSRSLDEEEQRLQRSREEQLLQKQQQELQKQSNNKAASSQQSSSTPFLCYPLAAGAAAALATRKAASMSKQPNDSQHLADSDDYEIATKIPGAPPSWYSRLASSYCVRSGVIYVVIVAVTAAAMVYGVSAKILSADNWNRHNGKNINNYANIEDVLQVAFVGNAYFFVNDVPRLLESVSAGHVYQNSCLHAGGTLADILVTGNGMYSLWQTQDAVIEYEVEDSSASCLSAATSSSETDDESESYASYYEYDTEETATSFTCTTYDYGMCTVAQILQGSDEYIAYGNKYGKYYSDGLNPCIMDTNYASFVETELQNDPITWDYVILVEQTKRMAVPAALSETLSVLTYRYGPMLATNGAIPVIVDTHAFWSNKSNMTGLTDIPTFTYLITQGVNSFVEALAAVVPSNQYPLVAPIGLAYLVVWEEDYDLWTTLFLDDGIHSSLSGSYMFACTLYATLFGQLPPENAWEFDDQPYGNNNNGNGGGGAGGNNGNAAAGIAAYFMDARKIVGQATYPSSDEVDYLRNVVQRVTLEGYIPPSMLEVEAAYASSSSSSSSTYADDDNSRRRQNRNTRRRRNRHERRTLREQ